MAYQVVVSSLYDSLLHCNIRKIAGVNIKHQNYINADLIMTKKDELESRVEFRNKFKSAADVYYLIRYLLDTPNTPKISEDIELYDLMHDITPLYIKELEDKVCIITEQKNKSDGVNVQLLLVNAEYKRHLEGI